MHQTSRMPKLMQWHTLHILFILIFEQASIAFDYFSVLQYWKTNKQNIKHYFHRVKFRSFTKSYKKWKAKAYSVIEILWHFYNNSIITYHWKKVQYWDHNGQCYLDNFKQYVDIKEFRLVLHNSLVPLPTA